MKITKKIFFLLAVFLYLETNTVAAHPFYVTLCQINFNEENHSLEISVKIFTDDLVAALDEQKINGGQLHIGEPEESTDANDYILNYLNHNLKIAVDEKPRQYYFVGKEVEDDALWCFFEIDEVNNFKEIEVFDSLLIEVYETQNNIVQVTKQGKTKNILLNGEKTKGSVNFK